LSVLTYAAVTWTWASRM